ncbi:hypothetical protein [Sinorhizobium prairiense]|uniref:hypothetical protein n=1 Tax=unclassified Sinorhizobium TaxID=2613772 RepID=UPI0023D8A8AF|nr:MULTISPECIES: hypothetical protein [unclassified Sinorhizobium]WEJ09954.1 AAA-like domain-containing protein [Sinorhizobium sp. M103]WEJ15494.1 AAA-like domain-containing protein [Sinorhizobium sp. K101]WEJ36917.1 AAA-like domain-containing protein [Sinorhizobium sp. C101]
METALYYPYMRIDDEGWLKATLFLFDQVQRIVPTPDVAGDTDAIRRYIHEKSKQVRCWRQRPFGKVMCSGLKFVWLRELKRTPEKQNFETSSARTQRYGNVLRTTG